jgi:zinc/manganese transport system substrate-binding protein
MDFPQELGQALPRCSNEGAAMGGTFYGDALSRPGGEADTYIPMLRHDVVTLKAGMLKN